MESIFFLARLGFNLLICEELVFEHGALMMMTMMMMMTTLMMIIMMIMITIMILVMMMIIRQLFVVVVTVVVYDQKMILAKITKMCKMGLTILISKGSNFQETAVV